MKWKAAALDAEPSIKRAQQLQFQSEIIAAREKGRAEQMQALAIEAIDLMRRVINASDVRMAPGIYFLLDKKGRVVYVGKSENVLFRMNGHKGKEFASVRMIHVPSTAERDRLERRFIHLLTPAINVSLTAFNESQKLLEKHTDELAQKLPSHSVEGAIP